MISFTQWSANRSECEIDCLVDEILMSMSKELCLEMEEKQREKQIKRERLNRITGFLLFSSTVAILNNFYQSQ
ncbi:Oidioi.mRNA.OKI2018_I69.XSR.g16775.t1.cds [Oikopleura dioica]|uniref:Oidioi.mRNA.OKI2018_I69.XSR.g16775.t1.cds n=1 Tax=Oikopleura dioica TaxID=34765 RepID=A0ABN7SH77_OIKDI|nr:Oidioi.mRNA.OKI2018_I69.XSR.g16775.t1.cds [Oikopleura dioica]